MPIVLQELMRHDSIETTLKYYVRSNAELTAQAVWDSCGATWQASGHVSRAAVTQPANTGPVADPSQEGKTECPW
jgi:hypothetical protein